MSGLELLAALKQLPARVLSEPVVISNCDPGEGAFFPARPHTGEKVRVVGFGLTKAIVIGRDLQKPKPYASRQVKPGRRGRGVLDAQWASRMRRPAKGALADVAVMDEFEDDED